MLVGKFGLKLACEQAHIWEHTRERQRANSKARQHVRKKSAHLGHTNFETAQRLLVQICVGTMIS